RPPGHGLTDAGRAGFLDRSPVGYGAYLDLLRAASAMTTLDGVREALRSGEPQSHRIGPLDGTRTELLTRAMHHRGRLAAARWPELVDLGTARTLLDVGGGSGVHAIA